MLEDYFEKKSTKQFHKLTDTLLYLAARNEHIKNTIKPAINKKKVIICDRFIDSTLAYQVYGKGVSMNLINVIHKNILDNVKPDITFIMKSKISKAMKRLNKRKNKNRYDRFSNKFYSNVQNAFIKIAKKNKSKYIIVDNSEDDKSTEHIIFNKFLSKFNK